MFQSTYGYYIKNDDSGKILNEIEENVSNEIHNPGFRQTSMCNEKLKQKCTLVCLTSDSCSWVCATSPEVVCH